MLHSIYFKDEFNFCCGHKRLDNFPRTSAWTPIADPLSTDKHWDGAVERSPAGATFLMSNQHLRLITPTLKIRCVLAADACLFRDHPKRMLIAQCEPLDVAC
jgi:hypothetical protein